MYTKTVKVWEHKDRHTETIPCSICKETGKRKTYEGNPIDCPYCDGTGKRVLTAVHPSHKMTEPHVDIIAPAGTPRFYTIRECTVCGKEEWKAAAGHFFHGLEFPCEGEEQYDSKAKERSSD